MTDYSQMSDFEINKRVAIDLDIDMHFFIHESEDSFGLGFLPSELGPIWQTSAIWVGDFRVSNGNKFNPCNNPADAWPIIRDNHISLHAPSITKTWMAEFTGSDDDVNDGFHVDYFESHHENPLRAAMIVFLMIQDSSNANPI